MKSNLSSIRFAAFIMTFERAHLIKETIDNLLEQSHPPEKILIIDNSISTKTQILIQELNNPKLEYFRVGKNSGPAGAAKIGLEKLTEEGFDWIYWGDDDDPPFFKDNFQILLSMAVQLPDCGCVGAVGQYFNKKNGLIVRVEDHELNKEGAIRVDNIAGNMSKIVNAEVIRKNRVLPDTTLFFGLEELDFDLALAKAGYALYADRQLYKRYRIDSNRLGVKTTRGGKKDSNKLLRDYYSTRNGLFIFRKNRLNMALIFNLCRAIFKIGMGYKYGANYGKRHSKYIWTGVVHFLQGKKGKFVFP
jgi:GT2 family glycosyltransferase